MTNGDDHRVSYLDARDNRRWLVGIAISVGFGLFGVVMALLSYSHRVAPAPAGAAAPAAHGPAAEMSAPRGPVPSSRERGQRRHQ
jgi:hypothetical protein